MYLKNLVLHGFKSFAYKTSIEFPKSLIGIVGPNGSGKSNICDAIRWVLGEQSSKILRGQKMDDVIFGGTATLPPSKFAEVRLTFDNKNRFFKVDDDEFTIVRKITRDGDSLYIINGEPCRLRDIKDQIMDTGLGRDAYSIIGQGMVESIISQKSSERRAIIEEAAGIVKYKADKAECLRKISLAQIDIDRLSDLIIELEKQLGPLSFEAQKAQKYFTLMSQLKTLKIKKMVYEYNQKQNEISNLKATINEYYKKREEHIQKIKIFETEIETIQLKINDLIKQKQELKLKNQEELVELENLQEQEKKLLTLIAQINTNRESYIRSNNESNERKKSIEAEIINLENEIKTNEEYLKNLELDIKKLEEDLANFSAKIKSNALELSNSESTTYEVINELASAKNKLIQFEGEQKYIQQQINKLKFDINKLNEKINLLKEKSAKKTDNDQSTSLRYKEILTEVSNLNKSLTELIEEEKSLEKTIQNDTVELINIRAKLTTYEEMKNKFEGYSRGVKFIMNLKLNNAEKFKFICGLVSELLSVPPQYELAIEVALGGNIQGIIVEKAKFTEELIEMLKREKIGRVTFYPLDSIKPQPPVVIPANLKGVIGIATDLIKCDLKYLPVYEYLLNPVMVVDTLKNVIDFISKNKFSGRIVTLEGENITSGGVITGGYIEKKSNTSIFSQDSLLSDLKSKAIYFDDKIEQNNQKLLAIRKKISNIKNKLEALNSEKIKLETLISQNNENTINVEQELNNAYEELKALNEELESKIIESQELEKKVNEYKNIVNLLEEKSRQVHDNIKSKKSNYDKENEEFHKLNGILMDKKVEFAACNQKLNNYRKKLIEHKEELDNLNKRNQLDRDLLLKFEEELKFETEKLTNIQEKLNELKNKTSDIQNLDSKLTTELENLESQIKIKTGLINSRNRQVNEIIEKVHEFEVKCTEFETEIKNLINLLDSEFKVRIDEYQQYLDPEFKYETASDEILILQRNIDALGIVNQSAIKDYQELSERISKLKSERDDLIKGRDDIYKIVKKTDLECTKLFLETFNAINNHIDEIFQLLFNGGQAKLILEDENNPLECNIDIKAQPPGKKLQSITLLSGGEKALTALSLLFAILKVKPSPFCILDEVEAALDEANVLRFVNMLNNFKEKTQFLIITHNKQTMQHLDMLYGVTMEEKGISKIISIQLEQAYDIVDMVNNKVSYNSA